MAFFRPAMYVVDTLGPILLLVLLGAVLRGTGFVAPDFHRRLNPLVYWFALPCLLFSKTAAASVSLGKALDISFLLMAGGGAGLLVAAAIARLARMPGPRAAAFVQGSFRGNLVYVGLPVVLFALGSGGDGKRAALESLAVLSIAPLIPFYNTIAVAVLLAGRKAREESLLRRAGRVLAGSATNPLILSCAAGVAYSFTGWELPVLVERSCGLLGQAALPLALVATGASMTPSSLRGCLAPSVAASVVKVGVGPAVGLALAPVFGLQGPDLLLAVLYLACPTAVVSFVMAEQLGADCDLAGGIVLVSTLLSLAVLAVMLAFL